MGAWKGGSTRAWRTIRARVLANNPGGQCQLHIPNVCTGQATHVHHILGRTITGDDPKYLMPTCAACNLHVGEPGKRGPKPTPTTRW